MKNILKRVVTVALAAVTLVSSLTVGNVSADALTKANFDYTVFYPKLDKVYPWNVELDTEATITNVEVKVSKAGTIPAKYIRLGKDISASDSKIKVVGGGRSKFNLLGYSRFRSGALYVEFNYKYKGKYRLADGLVSLSDIQGDLEYNFRNNYFSTTTKGDRSDYVEVINTLTGATKKMKGASNINVVGYALKDGTPYYKFKKTLTDKSTGKKTKVAFLVAIADTHGEELN